METKTETQSDRVARLISRWTGARDQAITDDNTQAAMLYHKLALEVIEALFPGALDQRKADAERDAMFDI
jgi:hypothetical protein